MASFVNDEHIQKVSEFFARPGPRRSTDQIEFVRRKFSADLRVVVRNRKRQLLDVEFVVDLRKKPNVNSPRVETPEYIISVGSQAEFISPVDRGVQLATSDMVRWLVDDYKMEPWAAHLLIGYQGRYDIVTVAGSVALKIPKKQLPQ